MGWVQGSKKYKKQNMFIHTNFQRSLCLKISILSFTTTSTIFLALYLRIIAYCAHTLR